MVPMGSQFSCEDGGKQEVSTLSEIVRKIRSEEIKIEWDLDPKIVLAPIHIPYEWSESQAMWWQRVKASKNGHYGYFFCIDVSDLQVQLLLFEHREDGITLVGEFQEAPDAMLLEAVEEAGGVIEMNGRYRINRKVKRWLHGVIWGQEKSSGKTGIED